MNSQERIKTFNETLAVVEDAGYSIAGKRLDLHSTSETREAVYLSGKEVLDLIGNPRRVVPFSMGGRCSFSVENMDTLECARQESVSDFKQLRNKKKPALVLNFANPFTPGGGVMKGARAQEEELCRRSTLYASLTSDKARAFYEDNEAEGGNAFTHGAVISPCVDVFRNVDGSLMEDPFTVAVITMAAPFAPGLKELGDMVISQILRTRIEGMLQLAVEHGYDFLVLGAWGCGVFGNDPNMVADAFLDVFKSIRGASHNGHSEGPGCDSLFSRVCFAILDHSGTQSNLHAFEDAFGDYHKDQDDAETDRVRSRIAKREEAHLDKFQGCLVGGAVGDALGYPVEFMSDTDIRRKYGSKGIAKYELDAKSGLALISDDTQMTLFTAAGILEGSTRMHLRGIAGHPAAYIYRAYLDWLYTQEPDFKDNPHSSWLADLRDLHARRAPGNTCLSALRSGKRGTMDKPLNNSKGCGGVMRVAPMGLFFSDSDDLIVAAAEVAAITHGHPLGYIPAAALAYIVHRCAMEIEPDCKHRRCLFNGIIDDCCKKLPMWFPQHARAASYTAELLQKALDLSRHDEWSSRNIREIGEGWVGDEALAIAVYACMRHTNDFGKAIIVAVNHDGDSDSTGAIAGNIMGAMHGLSGIDSKWLEKLELKAVILEVARDLCDDCPMEEFGHYRDDRWFAKYGTSCMGTIGINDFLRGNGA